MSTRKPRMERQRKLWALPTTKKVAFKSIYQVGQSIYTSGQFGKSYRCRRKKDKLIMAVKCIDKAYFYRLNASIRQRQTLLITMHNEMDVITRLQHKYIISPQQVYEDKYKLYIVMREYKGGTLYDRINQKQQRYNEINTASIIRMILQTLFFMQEYHRIIHCDLTPNNIFFVNKSQDSPIKIMDFGLSQILPPLISMRNLYNDSIYYTSPQIIKGDYSHKCDTWSVGVIMFVMLFGFSPFSIRTTNHPLLISGYIRLSKINIANELISLITMFHPNRFQFEREIIYRLILNGFEGKVKKGYGPWFPSTIPVSEESKDLMIRLMDGDVNKRFTAKEALQHPWIVNGGINRQKVGYSLQMLSFSAFNQFPYITKIFDNKYKHLKPRDFKDLRNIWKQLDVDGNGTINAQQFEDGLLRLKHLNLNKHHLSRVFQEIDGKINYECLINAVVHDYLIESDKRLYEAFHDLDIDKDGKIKTVQLKQKIKELNVYEKVDQLIKIIDIFDLDKNGTIDYEEYLRRVHKDFSEIPIWFWE